jgi:hypothetical protein
MKKKNSKKKMMENIQKDILKNATQMIKINSIICYNRRRATPHHLVQLICYK